jgi:hypothetical protein
VTRPHRTNADFKAQKPLAGVVEIVLKAIQRKLSMAPSDTPRTGGGYQEEFRTSHCPHSVFVSEEFLPSILGDHPLPAVQTSSGSSPA